jgi:hypothetical protein
MFTVAVVRFRLRMSMEWMNECVDWLFITQLLKACLSTVRVGWPTLPRALGLFKRSPDLCVVCSCKSNSRIP